MVSKTRSSDMVVFVLCWSEGIAKDTSLSALPGARYLLNVNPLRNQPFGSLVACKPAGPR